MRLVVMNLNILKIASRTAKIWYQPEADLNVYYHMVFKRTIDPKKKVLSWYLDRTSMYAFSGSTRYLQEHITLGVFWDPMPAWANARVSQRVHSRHRPRN